MVMEFQQVEYTPWEYDRWTIAELTILPDELSVRYGLRFVRGVDNLDYFMYAVIRLSDGTQVFLQHYPTFKDHPNFLDHGTYVWVDGGINFDLARVSLLAAFGLTPSAYRWVSPYSAASDDWLELERSWRRQSRRYPKRP